MHDCLAGHWQVAGQRKHTFASAVLISFALALSYPAYANYSSKAIAAADGNTLTVLHGREQVKVRLVGIGAPEKAQAFGNKSKKLLSELCFGKTATLADQGKDRHGRTLVRVNCAGIGVNAEQVRRRMALGVSEIRPEGFAALSGGGESEGC